MTITNDNKNDKGVHRDRAARRVRLGAYEYGVLKALHDRRPGFTPVAVIGISIGAVTAAVLES